VAGQGRGMRHATFVVVAAAMAAVFSPAVGGAAPGDPGPASQAAPQATLVRTDIFLPGHAPARTGGGKPQPSANCTNETTSSGSPAYTGSRSVGGTAYLNATTAPSSLAGQAQTEISQAFASWSSGRHAPAFSVVANGSVTKQTANHRTDVLFGQAPGNAIAVTYTWRWSTGEYESDTVFSNRVPWAVVPVTSDGCNENVAAYDLQSIATHEFGHIYGLDHPAGDRFATMYAYGYTGETLKQTLAPSDSAGIAVLYP
jgi:Matrixin